MAGDPAADLDPHLGGRQFELVVEHGDVGGGELEEVRRFLHRAPGLVHVSGRLQQHDLLTIDHAFGGLALKATAPWCETMTPCNLVDRQKTDIVPVAGVFRARITETDKKAHGAASHVGAPSDDRAPT